MTCVQLAKLLMAQPNGDSVQVVAKVGNDWVEVWGVCPTGEHRNAITFDLAMPGGGVIVVNPDEGQSCDS